MLKRIIKFFIFSIIVLCVVKLADLQIKSENYPSRHPSLMFAYNQAMAKKLYRNVKTKIGQIKSKAYSAKNHREYFAELSAMYFVGADYFPFSAERLKKYDFNGYKIIEQLWRISS